MIIFRFLFVVVFFLVGAYEDVPVVGWKQHFKNAYNFILTGE